MSESVFTKEQVESLFANDSPVISVISKKIRNRKKKLDKLVQKIMNCKKDKTKEVDPEDEKKKEKIEGQIKDLEETRQNLKDEGRNMLRGFTQTAKPAHVDDKTIDNIISNAIGRVADSLLINLLQNKFGVNDLLGDNEKDGLRAVLVPLENITHPTSNSVVYDRARDCFVEVFKSLAWGSEDIIPGSHVTFRHLSEQIDAIPGRVKNATHSLRKESVKKVVEEEKVEVTEAQNAAPVATSQPKEDIWNKESDDEDEKEPTIEQLAEEDAEREQVPIVPTKIAPKQFIDEDGFIHVKPHARPQHEHEYLKKKFRNNRQARKKHNDRFHVRGSKPLRGRGGRGHHDKHDLDDKGRKSKNAHGRHNNWKEGEVRVVRPDANE